MEDLNETCHQIPVKELKEKLVKHGIQAPEKNEIKTLTRGITDLLNSPEGEKFCDFTIFSSDGHEIKTSKLALAARSPYFRAHFDFPNAEDWTTLGYPAEVIRIILQCIMSDEKDLENVTVDFSDFCCFLMLLNAIDYLDLAFLKNHALKWIVKALNMDNCFEILNLVNRIDYYREAVDFCYSFILSSIEKLCLTKKMTRLDTSDLIAIFSRPRWLTFGLKDNRNRHLDSLSIELILVKALYEILKRREQTADFADFIRDCFKMEDLYCLIMPESAASQYICPGENIPSYQKLFTTRLDCSSYQLDPESDLAKALKTTCSQPSVRTMWPGKFLATPNSTGPEGQKWTSKSGKIEKIKVKFVPSPNAAQLRIIKGIAIFFGDGQVESFGMDADDIVGGKTIEVSKNSEFFNTFEVYQDYGFVTGISYSTNKTLRRPSIGMDTGGICSRTPRLAHLNLPANTELELVQLEGVLINHGNETYLGHLSGVFSFAFRNQNKSAFHDVEQKPSNSTKPRSTLQNQQQAYYVAQLQQNANANALMNGLPPPVNPNLYAHNPYLHY